MLIAGIDGHSPLQDDVKNGLLCSEDSFRLSVSVTFTCGREEDTAPDIYRSGLRFVFRQTNGKHVSEKSKS